MFQIAGCGEFSEAAVVEIAFNLATLAVRAVDRDANHDGLFLLVGVRYTGHDTVPVAHLEHFSGDDIMLPGQHDAILVLEVRTTLTNARMHSRTTECCNFYLFILSIYSSRSVALLWSPRAIHAIDLVVTPTSNTATTNNAA